MNSKVYKWCAVPLCKNTSIATPNKVFVYVPNKKTIRDKWLRLARRDPAGVVTSSPLYFCEDHFDLPNDMENYMQYHLMGSVSQVRMKPGCTPKNFACQFDDLMKRQRTSGSKKLPNILKKRKILANKGCKKQLEKSSIVTVHFESEEIASGSSDIKVEMEEVSAETNPYESEQECLGSLQRRLSPRKNLGANLGSFVRYDVDTEQVIYEVKTRPPLWDSSHTLYKNHCARVTAWLEIYESLFPDYPNLEYNTQKQIGKMVQLRWKTARDAYMKYKNLQKSSGDIIKKYTFSDIMTFLDKIHNADTGPGENDSSAIPDPYNATESQIESDENDRKMKKVKVLRKKKSDVDDVQHDYHKEVFTVVKQNLQLLQNDDIAFFMSLLPVIEKFSMHQKLMFRSEVIKKAMDISKNTI